MRRKIGNNKNVRQKLVGGWPTPLKNMSSSVGVIIPSIWKVIKAMFQTTNQKISTCLLSRKTPGFNEVPQVWRKKIGPRWDCLKIGKKPFHHPTILSVLAITWRDFFLFPLEIATNQIASKSPRKIAKHKTNKKKSREIPKHPMFHHVPSFSPDVRPIFSSPNPPKPKTAPVVVPPVLAWRPWRSLGWKIRPRSSGPGRLRNWWKMLGSSGHMMGIQKLLRVEK